ncbi:MAG: hypothetical protein WAK55_21765, partial [Xanthobacteraceae bacterium]
MRSIYQRLAAVVATPVRGILMMTVGSMTIGLMTPARTSAYCQPTFRGEPRKVGFHAGRGSRYVGNEVSTQTHRIRGARLPLRIGALGASTVRATSKCTGKQCKRASELENTHVVASALRVILRTVILPSFRVPRLIAVEAQKKGT